MGGSNSKADLAEERRVEPAASGAGAVDGARSCSPQVILIAVGNASLGEASVVLSCMLAYRRMLAKALGRIRTGASPTSSASAHA